MAYSAVISLSRTLDEINEPAQQITSLKEKVARLLEILEDRSQINHLEAQIRDASFEAEDIIESHLPRQIVVRSESTRCGVGSCFREMISALANMIPAIHLCERSEELVHAQDEDLEFQGLEKIIDEFDSILEDLSKIKNGQAEDSRPGTSFNAAASSRFVDSDKSSMVGVDEHLLQIKDRLTGWTSKLDTISIVGMGGIGKTTLVKNLYNGSLVEQHFDTRSWIVVSQEYNVQEMLSGLLKHSTTNDGGELHQKIKHLGECLHKSLLGRRYLIVMDDVWDIEAWYKVKRYFPDDKNGSRIILTTRLFEVASCASSIHHMSLLSSEASWDLLHEKVFGEANCPSELEEFGKQIAKGCKGLPLAIVVIGGLLSKGCKTQDYWKYMAENMKLVVSENVDQVKEILSLSYNSLPHHLKACFLYMGVFPEASVIFASQLIKFWTAEGFIRLVNAKSFEEVAEDYLNDLIDRSLILVHKRNHNGRIKTCIIHDLLRELCIEKAREENFLQILNCDILGFPEGKNNQLGVSIHTNIWYHNTDIRDSYARSLLYCCRRILDNQLISFTLSFSLLRLLDALSIIFYEFPSQIVELVHLRYLAFTYRGMAKFPESISKLRNLQTLVVYRRKHYASDSGPSFYLPSTIWEMPQLRHLLFDRSFLPYPIHAQIRGEDSFLLQNLQTLSEVTNFKCSKKVFEIMPNLKKLGISYLHDTDTKWSSYEFNNFVYLHKLETLKCIFIPKTELAHRPLPVNFDFPHSLRKLILSGGGISWKKMSIIGSLLNLEVLKLKNYAFSGSVWEPKEGEFSKLKFLLIDCSGLEHWRANDTHFPQLQHLSLTWCQQLMEIPLEIGEIPTLQVLELYFCRSSAVDSARRIQDEQQNWGNNDLRVRVDSFEDRKASRRNTSLRKVLLPTY